MKRGGAGNSGGSDLVFFDSRNDLYNQFKNRVLPLKAGMRNAELDSFVSNEGDSKFLDVSQLNEAVIQEIVDFYMLLPVRNGSQARFSKTKKQWISILERESRGRFSPYSVLIPRALRRRGRVHLISNDIFVSTNFLVCYGMSQQESLLLSTWISTIFYQLICEVSSKDQEGMRKMEVSDILLTYVPEFEKISKDIYLRLNSCSETIEFLDLKSPEIREVDRIWAETLWGTDAEVKLSVAKDLLGYLATKRNP